MGNENATERHVSFESGDPNDDGFGSPRSSFRDRKTFDNRDSYDVQGPQVRSRESTFSLGQRIQDRAQKTEDDFGQSWQQQTRTVQRPQLHTFGRPRVTEEQWYEDGYDAAPFHSTTRRSVYAAPNSRVTSTTYYPLNSRGNRSYHSNDYYGERSPGRAFNTRDQNDLWYHYRPEVNRRADWALVGRHVLRPASAAAGASGGSSSRVFYDDDSASSDPTSSRLRRGTGPGLVRRTDNPRVQNGSRTVYWDNEDDAAYGRWPGQTTYRYQRPANTYYQTYSYRR